MQVSAEGLRRNGKTGAWKMRITFLGLLALAAVAIVLIVIIKLQDGRDPDKAV